ncbi:uncharacterized protein LOC127779347 [Oryza glaberrima]|uniref:Uncharacterized protein n=1 Tax=Oryza glaberrima TaxID=4538 RepID=I1QEP6_ORYGL|nr:uncharacterized protein LOC127779347 [Oryza glaberrima]XP_052162044.1 uncharacterized protein LOC127779347 [Oryza glaberrima]XP_052162045.1 uncharacterized protein LOC127779347 [Oryza glaberrima]
MAVGDDAAPAATKISISGAALAALLQRCAMADGDCDGLLSGRASTTPAPPPSLSDYDDHAPAKSTPAISLSISGHSSLSRPSSLSDPLGRFHPSAAGPASIGFFSSRRRTALRPSMRELSLAHSLSKSLALAHPLLFLLVSPSSPNLSTHSYDHRAFLLIGSRLVPTSLHVVNVGPVFRDQYHSFAPDSPMPWLPLAQHSSSSAAAAGDAHTIGEQNAVDGVVDGFGLGKLQGILGSAAGQAAEMDGMYAGMLRRLEKLAREVEKSNLLVLKQENRNLLLRFRYAGLE